MSLRKGIFFVVSTPIGNLDDISFRAIEVLKSVDLILSEDTRETAKILNKYQIETQQKSYRDQNHDKVIDGILEFLELGNSIALVSDNGTPVISDPGFKLIRELVRNNIQIESVPGPSALISALSVSGLPTDEFVFLGFLPKKISAIQNKLEPLNDSTATIIFYESPHRIKKTLLNLSALLSDREVCLVKDITKMFQEIKHFRLVDTPLVIDTIKEKGEYVVLLSKKSYNLNG